MPSDSPPRLTYIHTHQLLRVPVEVESRRAHRVGTASGSDLLSPAILSGRTIVFRVFPTKLLRRLRYGLLPPVTKTPRDNPIDYPLPRQHYLGMESDATRTPSTHENLPSVETCANSTRITLRRLAYPSSSPSLKQIPALPTGAIAHAIATQRRFP